MKKILIFLFLLTCCSETPSEPKAEPEPEETVAGFYFMQGEQVNLTYQFPWPQWGGEEVILSRDTIETSFTMEMKFVVNKPDTIQLYGLHGVNDGNRFLFYPDCTETPTTCAYGKIVEDKLEIQLSHSTGKYTAMGTLKNGEIFLDAHFEYRNVGVEYSLKGMKVKP